LIKGKIEVKPEQDRFLLKADRDKPTIIQRYFEGIEGKYDSFKVKDDFTYIEFDEEIPVSPINVYQGDFFDPYLTEEIKNSIAVSKNDKGFSYIHFDPLFQLIEAKSEGENARMVFSNPEVDVQLRDFALSLKAENNYSNDLNDDQISKIINAAEAEY
jgi:hypothetical protein